MTFALVVLLGVGILLVVSAFEDVSISQTLRDLLNGKLSPATPAQDAPTAASAKNQTAPKAG